MSQGPICYVTGEVQTYIRGHSFIRSAPDGRSLPLVSAETNVKNIIWGSLNAETTRGSPDSTLPPIKLATVTALGHLNHLQNANRSKATPRRPAVRCANFSKQFLYHERDSLSRKTCCTDLLHLRSILSTSDWADCPLAKRHPSRRVAP